MESRAFVKHATNLIKSIKDHALVSGFQDMSLGGPDARQQLQKEINQLFSSLQNPTLPTAYRLRDTALENGFSVDQRVQQRLAQFEHLS